jgi:hypothetical protein
MIVVDGEEEEEEEDEDILILISYQRLANRSKDLVQPCDD